MVKNFIKYICAFTILFSTNIQSQSAEPQKVKDTPPVTYPEWLNGLQIGGMVRFRPEFRSNASFDKSKDDVEQFVGQKIQVSIEKQFTEDTSAKIVLQDTRLWGQDPGSKIGLSTANNLTNNATDIREAYFQVKNLIGPVGVKMGRQILAYDDQRLVGALDWTNTGRSFDTAKFIFENKYIRSHLWGAILAEQHSDIAGNTTGVGRNNVSGISYQCDPVTKECKVKASTVPELDDAYFTGFYNTILANEHLHISLYYLGVYQKWIPSNTAKYDIPGSQITTQDRQRQRDNLHTVGFRLTNRTQGKPGLTATSTIPFDWTFEYATQRGTTGQYVTPQWDYSNSKVYFFDPLDPSTAGANPFDPNSGRVISEKNLYKEKQLYDTFAYSAKIGYTFKLKSVIKKLRLGADFLIGSGDNNRTDGKVSTFQNLFHTNHNLFGVADQTSWRNIIGRSLNVKFDLDKFGVLEFVFWHISKHREQDAWYSVPGPIRSGDSTESVSNNRFKASPTFMTPENVATANKTDRGVAYLGKHLFKEYDIVYVVNYKGLNWNFGYAISHAGDAIREARNNTLAPINQSNRVSLNYKPRSDFMYLMTTYTF